MQLILEAESKNINISEKMSALEQVNNEELIKDKPTTNGTSTQLNGDLSEKSHNNANCKETENKENITVNTEETQTLNSADVNSTDQSVVSSFFHDNRNGDENTETNGNIESETQPDTIGPKLTETSDPETKLGSPVSTANQVIGNESDTQICKEIEESPMDIDQIKDLSSDKENLLEQPPKESVEPMDTDNHLPLGKELEENLTASISAVVNEIVEGLNHNDNEEDMDLSFNKTGDDVQIEGKELSNEQAITESEVKSPQENKIIEDKKNVCTNEINNSDLQTCEQAASETSEPNLDNSIIEPTTNIPSDMVGDSEETKALGSNSITEKSKTGTETVNPPEISSVLDKNEATENCKEIIMDVLDKTKSIAVDEEMSATCTENNVNIDKVTPPVTESKDNEEEGNIEKEVASFEENKEVNTDKDVIAANENNDENLMMSGENDIKSDYTNCDITEETDIGHTSFPKENEIKNIENESANQDNREVSVEGDVSAAIERKDEKVEADTSETITESMDIERNLPQSEDKDVSEKPDEKQNSESEQSNIETELLGKPTKDVTAELQTKEPIKKVTEQIPVKPIISLSNTMEILSDDEEDSSKEPKPRQELQTDIETKASEPAKEEKNTINLDDDDDIMVIDEETNKDEEKQTPTIENITPKENTDNQQNKIVELDSSKDNETSKDNVTETTDPSKQEEEKKEDFDKSEIKNVVETTPKIIEKPKPLVPDDFFKTYRKNLTDMTREDLEEFCILKIVESIIDRSNLNEIRSKLKTMAQSVEEYKKKAMMLTKQNRDLQVVLKSVQEEQKKVSNQMITPLKITRSVGMQVLMTDKVRRRPHSQQQQSNATANGPLPIQVQPTSNNNMNNINNRPIRNANQSPRNTPQKQVNNNQPIPVPRLVPATQLNNKNTGQASSNIVGKAGNNMPANVKISPVHKGPEKRTHKAVAASSAVTVDLTDDEPPAKVGAKGLAVAPAPPVRLVNTQNLLARPTFPQVANSPRKVYIPINVNGQQTPTIRPGQTILTKVPQAPQGARPRGPAPLVRAAGPAAAVRRLTGARHPAPLPDAVKSYQPPNWKALPPAPDLKLSKVENGIVISWKIEGYQEDSYEEIASYQLYAYQETSAPPSTSLWKKIGDVKALPLPMACTLTQFMAGYKYYFAVRAVDIRSRLGPFSLPGSILLLNKM